MAISTPASPSSASDSPARTTKPMFVTDDGQRVFITFVLLALLFGLWGLCNAMIDVMDKHFQEQLNLSLEDSAWVQAAHYSGYLIMAMPAGWLATRLGYKGSIIIGLLIVAVGGFWFIPATHINAFWAFLVGVCTIAAGLTFLETVANPYTTVLGPLEYAAARINIAQSFNGLALVFGPLLGARFFYSKNAAGVSTGSETLWIPYAVIGGVVLLLAVVFCFAKMPDIKMEDDYGLDAAPSADGRIDWWRSWLQPWSRPHFAMAVVAQFLYVGAQAAVWSFFINYVTSQTPQTPASWDPALQHLQDRLPGWFPVGFTGWFETHQDGSYGFSDKGGASLASLGFLLFTIGRFIGSAILRRASAHRVLGVYGIANGVLCLLVFLKLGWVSFVCVFLSYFFMSIMFPTIFALGIFGLGEQAKRASSFIVMAICGGALLPKVMGKVAGASGLSHGFIVPLLCFTAIGAYGYLWPKLSGHETMVGVNTSKGH